MGQAANRSSQIPEQMNTGQISFTPPQNNDETIDLHKEVIEKNETCTVQLPPFPSEDFVFLEPVGEGGNGTVFKAYNKRSSEYLAIKKLPLKDPSSFFSNQKTIISEVTINELVSSSSRTQKHFPNRSLNYYGCYQDKHFAYLSLQLGLVSLLELLDTGRCFSPKEVVYILHELTESVLFLRSQGIAHRDIKLNNVILVPTETPYIYEYKLCDFGSGISLDDGDNGKAHRSSLNGITVDYVAPEVNELLRNHGEDDGQATYDPFKAEVYSLGILALKLLKVTFNENTRALLETKGLLGGLLLYMLNNDPCQRVSLEILSKNLIQIMENMRIQTPKIENGYVYKAIQKRINKRNMGDYNRIITELHESFEKYCYLGSTRHLTEIKTILQMSSNEILKQGSLLRLTYEEAQNLINTGLFFERTGHFSLVSRLVNEAVRLCNRLYEKNARTSFLLCEATELFLRIGDVDSAEKTLKIAFDTCLEVLGEKNLVYGVLLRLLGELAFRKMEIGKAVEFINKAVECVHDIVYSEKKMTNYEILMKHCELFGAEERMNLRRLEAVENAFGNNDNNNMRHSEPLICIEDLEKRMPNLTRQETLYLNAFKKKQESWKNLLARIKKELAKSMSSLAKVYLFVKEFKKSESLLTKSLKAQERLFGELSLETSNNYHLFSLLYLKKGDFDKAEKFSLRSLLIKERIFSGEKNIINIGLIESWFVLEECYTLKGEFEKAKEMNGRIEKGMEKLFGQNNEKIKKETIFLKN